MRRGRGSGWESGEYRTKSLVESVQGVGEWATTSKGVCSKCAIAACCVRAGSARTPTTALATRCWPTIFDAGTIDGVDVTGRTIAIVSHIPGNVLNGNFRGRALSRRGTSDPQQEALLNV